MKIQLRGLALVAVLLGALLGLHIKSLKEDGNREIVLPLKVKTLKD